MALTLYPFRYRDQRTGKWHQARYLAELHEISARYAEWEIIGPPEVRPDQDGGHFTPYPRTRQPLTTNIDRDPSPDQDERRLVLLFLRRYVTYCARRQRYAQMQGAARLYKLVRLA